MREGGARFEGYANRTPETPQQQFRHELRGDVHRILETSLDPLSVEIAHKILEKIRIKDLVDEIQRYRDDTAVYQQWKQLGLFIVIDSAARIDWEDKTSGFMVKKGDSILDIHLPPVPEGKRQLSTVTDSMRLIAEYIVRHDLHPKYIMGVTFEKLARMSKQQGFKVIEPEVPEDIKHGVENVFRRFTDRGIDEKSMGKILLCYQDTQTFLQKFGIQRYEK